VIDGETLLGLEILVFAVLFALDRRIQYRGEQKSLQSEQEEGDE
jgi:hypothetical protein